MSAQSPTLKRLLKDFSAAVFDDELVGEWRDDDFAAALDQKLEGVDLNGYRGEIIRLHVGRDVSERAKRPVFIPNEDGIWQPSMFTEDLARQGVLRLGNGERVKMFEATGLHWMSHLFQQQKALHSTSQAIGKVVQWLESSPGVTLTKTPGVKTYEVMQQLGFWGA
jgi:hypothetical protein